MPSWTRLPSERRYEKSLTFYAGAQIGPVLNLKKYFLLQQFDDMKAMKARADVEKAKYLAMNKKINGPYEPDVSDMAGPFWYEKNSLPMD